MKFFILALFILTYIMIIWVPKRKTLITMISAVICAVSCLIFKKITFREVALSIDYNVVLMLFGIMITVGLFSDSNMPNRLSDKLISKIPNSLFALVLLSVLSGIISAFIDNVATVLMLAPIGLSVAKKIGVSPIPVIISIAVSSNLQGAATLVGDTTSIMLASSKFADMSFFDFFFINGRLSIFWAVEIGAILTIPILIYVFRKDNKKLIYNSENITVSSVVPSVLLLLNIVLLVAVSFIPNKPDLTNGLICVGIGVIGLIYYVIRFKSRAIKTAIDSIDYKTILFLIFLFIIIACVEKCGIINDIGKLFSKVGGKNIFLLYFLIVFGSVLFSAVIDNIPYVATMLPVVATIAVGEMAKYSYLLYFGLLIGATLGGNLTPVGASANVVGIGILQKEGLEVKTSSFLKIGVPFTMVAVFGGALFVWLTWGLI
ncbi:MAG: TRAP transporter large permease subunit [Clostridia bacterium]|nr:TRAP transporter large permease subunit [Clostridia bacterium]